MMSICTSKFIHSSFLFFQYNASGDGVGRRQCSTLLLTARGVPCRDLHLVQGGLLVLSQKDITAG